LVRLRVIVLDAGSASKKKPKKPVKKNKRNEDLRF
jgi:hypothetical protein